MTLAVGLLALLLAWVSLDHLLASATTLARWVTGGRAVPEALVHGVVAVPLWGFAGLCAWVGYGDLAVAGLMGAAVGQATLVLGVAAWRDDVVARSDRLRRLLPVLLVGTTLAWWLAWDGRLDRLDGVVLLATAALAGVVDRTTLAAESEAARRARIRDPWRPVHLALLVPVTALELAVAGMALLDGGQVSSALVGLVAVGGGAVATQLVRLPGHGVTPDDAGRAVLPAALWLLGGLGVAALVQPLVLTPGLSAIGLGLASAALWMLTALTWSADYLERFEGALLVAAWGLMVGGVLAFG